VSHHGYQENHGDQLTFGADASLHDLARKEILADNQCDKCFCFEKYFRRKNWIKNWRFRLK
jgi:hypothetical protein